MSIQDMVPSSLDGLLRPAKQEIMSHLFGYNYHADGLAVAGRNLELLRDAKFKTAWEHAVSMNEQGYTRVPDIRWRAHVACWFATQALDVPGDFVECGVHTGLLSHTLCQYLNFSEVDKRFWLFDTFEGIPLDQMSDTKLSQAHAFNETYFDCYDLVEKSFACYPNVHLIKGRVPESLTGSDIKKVSYLSLDMNNAFAEVEALKWFWPKMSDGAFILLDDYGFAAHHEQKAHIDRFLADHDKPVLILPTGQGVIAL